MASNTIHNILESTEGQYLVWFPNSPKSVGESDCYQFHLQKTNIRHADHRLSTVLRVRNTIINSLFSILDVAVLWLYLYNHLCQFPSADKEMQWEGSGNLVAWPTLPPVPSVEGGTLVIATINQEVSRHYICQISC